MEHQEFGLSGGAMVAKSTRRPVRIGGCAAGARRPRGRAGLRGGARRHGRV